MFFKKLRDFFAAKPSSATVEDAPKAVESELIAPSDLVQNHLVRQQLLAEIEQMTEKARARQQDPSYWHNVGYVQAGAVSFAKGVVLEVSVDLPHAEYREAIRQPFKRKIQAYWNDDDADPDGYGLGTLYGILEAADLRNGADWVHEDRG
jgi:hypothetical protein